jgi:hypothetical protein
VEEEGEKEKEKLQIFHFNIHLLSPKINSFSHHFFTTFVVVVVVVKTTGIDSKGAVLGHCKNSLRANEDTF